MTTVDGLATYCGVGFNQSVLVDDVKVCRFIIEGCLGYYITLSKIVVVHNE